MGGGGGRGAPPPPQQAWNPFGGKRSEPPPSSGGGAPRPPPRLRRTVGFATHDSEEERIHAGCRDRDLHLAPRRRGEVEGRRPEGEGPALRSRGKHRALLAQSVTTGMAGWVVVPAASLHIASAVIPMLASTSSATRSRRLISREMLRTSSA